MSECQGCPDQRKLTWCTCNNGNSQMMTFNKTTSSYMHRLVNEFTHKTHLLNNMNALKCVTKCIFRAEAQHHIDN